MLKRALLTAARSSLNSLRYSSSKVDSNEIRKFSQETAQWWKDSAGVWLKLNSVRVPYIREKLLATRNIKSLEGIAILDVGSGGGVLSEALARTGATVTGIDPSVEMINIARTHKMFDPSIVSRLKYKLCTLQDLPADDMKYDCVVASEIIEHVPNGGEFTRKLAEVVSPGGSVIITTLNRTNLSYWAAIVYAENVLGLEKGHHIWEQFVTPAELQSLFDRCKMAMESIQGISLNPLTGNWSLSSVTAINYMAHFVKSKD